MFAERIAFNSEGVLMPGVRYVHSGYTFYANEPFVATIEFQHRKTFQVRDVGTGKAYPMFPSDVNSLIVNNLLDGSRSTGVWRVRQVAEKWGLARVGDVPVVS